MRKKLRQILFLMTLIFLLGSSHVSAAQEGEAAGLVYDDAYLLSESEIADLDTLLAELSVTTGWNVFAVTTGDARGKSAQAYADDFFDEHSPEKEDGVAFLIDMDNREIWISTCGEAIRYLTDDRIDAILDEAYGYVSDAYYAECLETMINETYYYYGQGIVSGQYNYDEETGEVSVHRSIEPVEAVVAVILALVSGGAVFGITAGKYQLKFGTYQYPFHDFGTVDLRVKKDRYVNQVVTHRRIPKQTSSGGGGGRSSTHSSSSGRSHGGGGRSF